MEYPVKTFLTIILLTFATDHICCETIIVSQNPLPVGSNVNLMPNLHNQFSYGVWNFGSDPIVVIVNCLNIIFPDWQGRVTVNCTTAELSISSLQVSDSGLYKFVATNQSGEGEITLSVQELISNASLRVNAAHLVEFSDSAVFHCDVSSGSSLAYLWTNASSVVTPATKGVQLSGNDSILTIANVTRYDSGPFMCQVSNALSNASSAPIRLEISYGPSRPTMVISPKMTVYRSWSNITLSCHAESNPNATVQWFFNETDLRFSASTIQLNHITENQTGYYKCLFHNAVTNRNISVKTLIRIIDPISHVAVRLAGGPAILGQAVTLVCDVNKPVESITWYTIKNGQAYNVTSRSDNSLTLDPVMRSEAGDYKCQAFNSVSNMTSNLYKLIVNYGPEVPVISGKHAALKGHQVTLNCSASSQPPSQYHWYFNGSLVANTSHYVTEPLTMNMSGKYECKAHNNITGNDTMASITLTVYAPVSTVMVTTSAGYPIMNYNFSLTCDTVGSVESIYWMKNGSVIQTTGRVMLNMDNSTLTFSPVLASDTDYYECKAANPVSSLMSGPHALHVAYGPSVPVITGPKVAIYGENLTLSCSAESYPASDFHWKFYSKSAMGNASVSVSNTSKLELTPLMVNMSGVYKCIAYNNVTHQSAYTEKRLTVLGPLTHVHIEYPSTVPIQGHSFTLRCNTTGGVDHVYWMRNGEKLYPDNTTSMHNQMLTLNPLLKRDSGYYQCTAANDKSNMTSATYRLLVMYGPEVPVIVGKHAALKGHQVTLNCSASSQPPSQYHWYFNGSLVANTSHYVTEPLTMNMSGKYECKAHNNITGNDTMASITLTVYAPVSKVMVTTSAGYPIMNYNFSLTCDTVGLVESIYWMKNGSVIQTTGRVMLNMDNTTLTFSPVLASDTDYYECKAANPASSLMSGPHALHVAFGPNTPIITGPMNAETGEDVVFTCLASSYPPSYYSWYHKDHLGQTYLLSNDSKLTTGPLSFNMSGEYTCVAMNNVTKDNSTKSRALVVIERIEHVAIKEDSLPIQSHNYTLICEVTGPYDSIYWTKNGTRLESSNPSTNYSHSHPNYSHSNTNYSHSNTNYSHSNTNYSHSNTNYSHPNYSHSNTNYSHSNTNYSHSNTNYSHSNTNYSHTNYSHSHTNYSHSNTHYPHSNTNYPHHNSSHTNSSHSHQAYYMKNNILHFSPVTTNDDGVYRCFAVNVVRPHSSPEYKLLVNYGPLNVRINGPETVHTGSGISVSFTCAADSRPMSQFQWFVGSGQGTMQAGPQITLSAFEPNLTCKAYNNVTGISMSKSVTVNLNVAPSHSLASPGILLFMTLSALSVSVLGDIFVI